MKLIVSLLFAAGTLAAPVALPTFAVASTDVALACPADAPAGWKRPGGYCEVRNSLDTIGTEKGTGGEGGKSECEMLDGAIDIESLQRFGKGLLVAGDIDPCCEITSAVLPRVCTAIALPRRSRTELMPESSLTTIWKYCG